MRMVVLLVVALLASAQQLTTVQAQTLGLINGGSSFFEPVIEGWLDKCKELGITCHHRTVSSGSAAQPCPVERVKLLRELMDLGINGLAIKPCGTTTADGMQQVYDLAASGGIPVINLDSDIPNATRAAYVGTDNALLGRTLARLLQQLRPEGGEYALVGEKFDRTPFFKEEMREYNSRQGLGQWYEVPGEWSGKPEQDEGYIGFMEKYARLNPTAIVCMVQSPMRETGWNDFVDAHRAQNITYIGTDASEEQLKLLYSHYVDGAYVLWHHGGEAYFLLYLISIFRQQSRIDTSKFQVWWPNFLMNLDRYLLSFFTISITTVAFPKTGMRQRLFLSYHHQRQII
jgi:Periplasmic binding protein domain